MMVCVSEIKQVVKLVFGETQVAVLLVKLRLEVFIFGYRYPVSRFNKMQVVFCEGVIHILERLHLGDCIHRLLCQLVNQAGIEFEALDGIYVGLCLLGQIARMKLLCSF